MRIKDIYKVFPYPTPRSPSYKAYKEFSEAPPVNLKKGDVIINTTPGKPWFIYDPEEHKDLKLTSFHAIARPLKPVEEMEYPPIYLIQLPMFYGRLWSRGSRFGYLQANVIRDFEFPIPPPPKDEMEKLNTLMESIRKLVALREKANKQMDQLHYAIAHRVVVEGKPLKKTEHE